MFDTASILEDLGKVKVAPKAHTISGKKMSPNQIRKNNKKTNQKQLKYVEDRSSVVDLRRNWV